MKNVLTPLLLPVAGLLLLAGVAHASTAASSASDSASSTTSSASDSIGDSSRSSSGDKRVAAGEYRVLNVAQGPRAGTVQARLRNDEGAEFSLVLPETAALKGGLVAEARVVVSEQNYGWAFARADNREVFFLALEDNRALQSRAL